MIGIKYNSNKDRFEVTVYKTDSFYEIIDLLKNSFFKFDSKNKIWHNNAIKMYGIYNELQEYDIINISDNDLYMLQNYVEEKKETKFIRRSFNEALLKYPPIKGLPPNEEYQLEDIKRGIKQNRLYLMHQQGLGKTYILINIIQSLWVEKEIDKILIVVPSEALFNWRRELLKFSDLWQKEDIFIADRFNRKPFEEKNKIIIMTYRTFVMISDDYYKLNNPNKSVKKYKKPQIPFIEWNKNICTIFDEFHLCKNKTSQRFHKINIHKNYFKYRYAASGTPYPQGVADLWSQLHILDEGIIPYDYYDWIKQIANVGTKYSKYAIDSYKPEEVEKFVEGIKPYVIRRKSKDHIKLPDMYINKIYCGLSRKQENIYKAIITETLQTIQDSEMNKFNNNSNNVFLETRLIMQKFPFLSLALDNPCILRDNPNFIPSHYLGKLLNSWKFTDHSKLEITSSLLEKYIGENHKVILWSGHPATIDSLAKHYKKYKPLTIHGGIKIDKSIYKNSHEYKDYLVEKFKKSDSQLLIASYLVLSTAVNITEASRNIYFDRSYDLKYWLQSIKRTHRIGQDKMVIVNPLIFEDSLDIRLDNILTKKENVDKHLFDRDRLSNEEWRKIFLGETIDY